jgi:hypothetical protein
VCGLHRNGRGRQHLAHFGRIHKHACHDYCIRRRMIHPCQLQYIEGGDLVKDVDTVMQSRSYCIGTDGSFWGWVADGEMMGETDGRTDRLISKSNDTQTHR